MVYLYNRDAVRPSRLAVGEGVQSRAKNGVLVDATGNRARQTIFGDAGAQAEMDARSRIRHVHDRRVLDAQRFADAVTDEGQRERIVKKLGIFVEELMRGAGDGGCDCRPTESLQTHGAFPVQSSTDLPLVSGANQIPPRPHVRRRSLLLQSGPRLRTEYLMQNVRVAPPRLRD